MFTATTAKEGKENMINEGGSVLQDAKDGARRLRNDTRETAQAVKEDLHHAARRTGEYIHDLADNASHSVSDVTGTVKDRIRDNPVQSSVIAAAVGFVIGLLFRR